MFELSFQDVSVRRFRYIFAKAVSGLSIVGNIIILKYSLKTGCKMFSSSEYGWNTCNLADSFFPQDECATSSRLNVVKLS